MMRMKKPMTVTASIVMLVFSASLVLAQSGGGMKHRGPSQATKEKKEKTGGMMGGGGMMGMMSGMMSMMSGTKGCGMMDGEGKIDKHFALCLNNADKLGLSDKQVAELKKIHNEQKKKLIMLKAQIRVIDVDLSTELEKDVPSLDKVEELLKKQERLKTKYRLELIKTRIESSKVLTGEQRKKLKKLMGGMMGMMGSMGGGKGAGMKGMSGAPMMR